MLLRFLHKETGKVYTVPITQATVLSDDGYPVAFSYEHQGLIVHSDRGHKDFDAVCASMCIQAKPQKVTT